MVSRPPMELSLLEDQRFLFAAEVEAYLRTLPQVSDVQPVVEPVGLDVSTTFGVRRITMDPTFFDVYDASSVERRSRIAGAFSSVVDEPTVFPDVAFLNPLIGMPSPYADCQFADGFDVGTYFFDFQVHERTEACLDDLESARRSGKVRFDDKTLILSAAGLDPLGERLVDFARQFARHHVMFELWNMTSEVVDLARARPADLYFLPVSSSLVLEASAASMQEPPNRRVFVSLGGDDDLDLIGEVVARRRDLQFLVPDVAWHKFGSLREHFPVSIEGPNVSVVPCKPAGYSSEYYGAYASCDTVLVSTSAHKLHKMRGGLRVADALRARKRLVVTRNPMCELLMAQHERTCLVSAHDPSSVLEALERTLDTGFRVDVPTFETIRSLTLSHRKAAWMMRVPRDPATSRSSPFWRDPASLTTFGEGFLDALFDLRRGQRVELAGVAGLDLRVVGITRSSEATYDIELAGAGLRPLVVQLSTAGPGPSFCVTPRGHRLSYRGTDATAREALALRTIAQYL